MQIAKKFIHFILDDKVQETEEYFFSVKKDVQLNYLKTVLQHDDEISESFGISEINTDSLDDFFTFDWNQLIINNSTSVELDYIMEQIIFEQATKLYTDEISIDVALSECMSKINIIIAERN